MGFLSCACAGYVHPAVRVKKRLAVTGIPCSLAYPTKSAVGTKSGEPFFVTFATNSLMDCFVGPSFQNGSGPAPSTVAVAMAYNLPDDLLAQVKKFAAASHTTITTLIGDMLEKRVPSGATKDVTGA